MMPIVGNLNNIVYAAPRPWSGGMLAVAGRFDIGSLAAFLQYSRQVGMPVQQITNQLNTVLAALAGAERVFEVMDQRARGGRGVTCTWSARRLGRTGAIEPEHATVRIPRTGPGTVPRPDGVAGLHRAEGRRAASTMSRFGLRAGQGRAARRHAVRQARPEDRLRRLHRRRQDHHHQPDQPLLRDRRRGRSPTTGSTSSRSARTTCADPSAWCCRTPTSSPARSWRTSATAGWMRPTRSACRRPNRPTRIPSSGVCRRGTRPMITADGANLSQGQRQLLAIARTAVADPPVMILDEATSSIDTRTERLDREGHGRPDEGPDRLRHRPPPVDRAQRRRDPGDRERRRSSSAATTTTCWSSAGAITSCTRGSTNWIRRARGRGRRAVMVRRGAPPRDAVDGAFQFEHPSPSTGQDQWGATPSSPGSRVTQPPGTSANTNAPTRLEGAAFRPLYTATTT